MATIREITVSAGRTFNHPFESYSNLKPQVTVKATLAEGEDWREATKELQAQAESLVEDHKRHMLRSLEEIDDLKNKQHEVARLDETIRSAQARLDALRAGKSAAEVRALDDDSDGQPF